MRNVPENSDKFCWHKRANHVSNDKTEVQRTKIIENYETITL